MSKINVNTWEPESGTAATLMASGDTVTLPDGAILAVASGGDINVAFGGEIDIASGATLDVNGTIDLTGATKTGFPSNTPRFLAYNSTDTTAISDATYTTVVFDTELIDSDTAFATNTFTVPAGEGGVYYFHSSVECGDNTLGYLNSNAIRFRKTPDGGSAATIAYNNFTGQSLTYGAGWTATTRGWWDTISLDLVVTLAALDAIHVEVSVDVHAGGAGAKIFGDTASIPRTKFMGYKLL